MKNAIKMGLLVCVFSLGSQGFAFAGDVGSEAGADVIASGKALAAAAGYSYDQNHLDRFATEAGADVAPSSSAAMAAKNYSYDAKELDLVGTEAGLDAVEAAGRLSCIDC